MRMRQLLFAWLGLLVLGAIEFACTFLPFGRSLRPLLMLPALCMVGIVALVFMNIRAGPPVARVFAIAGLFWLTILLGLGMVDPLTRAVYQVTE